MNKALGISAAVLALVLAGCGGKESTEESARQSGEISLTNASLEEVSKQVNAAADKQIKQQPGQWELTTELVSYDLSGLGDAPERKFQESMMEMAKGKPQKQSKCITADQIAKQKAIDVTKLAQVGGDCRFGHYKSGGGKVDMAMTCTGPQGKIDAQYTGTQTATSQDLTVNATQTPPGKGAVKTSMKISAKRLGDCPATPAASNATAEDAMDEATEN